MSDRPRFRDETSPRRASALRSPTERRSAERSLASLARTPLACPRRTVSIASREPRRVEPAEGFPGGGCWRRPPAWLFGRSARTIASPPRACQLVAIAARNHHAHPVGGVGDSSRTGSYRDVQTSFGAIPGVGTTGCSSMGRVWTEFLPPQPSDPRVRHGGPGVEPLPGGRRHRRRDRFR